MPSNITKIAAGAAAVVAIGVGAAAVGSASSGNDSPTANHFSGPGGAAGQAPPGFGRQRGGGPGFGTPVTGTAAAKVTAAALAKYPGTVERVLALPDGTYVAHVMKKDGSGEVHVLVDANFDVTGTQSRPSGPPPGAGAGPGSGGAPPAGGQPGGAAPPSGSGAGTSGISS